MRRLFRWFLFLLLTNSTVKAQSFQFAGKDAVKVPETSLKKIRHYIEKHDGILQLSIGNQYPYIPVFNVLSRKERQFRDGLYYFNWGAHDSGRLFIQRKGIITFLANDSVTGILADYTNYLKQHPLSEATQTSYLSAISAFMKFRYEDQNMLIRSGALE